MTESAAHTVQLWPLAVYFIAVLLLAALMIGLSSVLGQHHQERATNEPYESGMVPISSARLPVAVKFYLVAVLFVIFDLEAVFIFAWSLIVREAGWTGYIEILIFIAILLVALVYLWRQKALDWGSRGRQKQPIR